MNFMNFLRPTESIEDEPVQNANLPAGSIKWKDGTVRLASSTLVGLVIKGAGLKTKLDAIADQLEAIKAEILFLTEPGVTINVEGVCRVPIVERVLITVKDPDKLQTCLGGRFQDLVRTEIKHFVTPKLMEIIDANPESDYAKLIQDSLAYNKSVSVSYRSI